MSLDGIWVGKVYNSSNSYNDNNNTILMTTIRSMFVFVHVLRCKLVITAYT